MELDNAKWTPEGIAKEKGEDQEFLSTGLSGIYRVETDARGSLEAIRQGIQGARAAGNTTVFIPITQKAASSLILALSKDSGASSEIESYGISNDADERGLLIHLRRTVNSERPAKCGDNFVLTDKARGGPPI